MAPTWKVLALMIMILMMILNYLTELRTRKRKLPPKRNRSKLNWKAFKRMNINFFKKPCLANHCQVLFKNVFSKFRVLNQFFYLLNSTKQIILSILGFAFKNKLLIY